MKFCSHCGAQLNDEAVVCVHCGCSVANAPMQGQGSPAKKDDTLATVIKIFMILGCVSIGWCIIPLAWCIPMTISVFKSLNAGEPISTGMKVCTLLFVNMIAGICMLCMKDENY